MQVGSSLNHSYLRINNGESLHSTNSSSDTENKQTTTKVLTPSEQAQVKELQARDTEVRAHEAAHLAAGAGIVTGGASFTYQRGPDQKQYAIGGEVPIDASPGKEPQETISKMQRVRTAALAPRDPSATDYQVATTAMMLEMKARLELNQQVQEENNPYTTSEEENSTESSLDLVA